MADMAGKLPSIAALVLAAGRSSRFEGGHKLLAPIGGVPLIRRVLAEVSAAGLDDIVLVLAPDGADIAAAAGAGPWRTRVNTEAAEGLASSIRAGVSALGARVTSAAIVLADMPGVSAELIASLAEESAVHPEAIVYPNAPDGRQGHPVFWPRALFPALLALSGDAGAKALIDAHAGIARALPLANARVLADIDTRDDLQAFSQKYIQ